MTCYKLVSVEFKWWGLQGKMERYIHKVERQIFQKFHRQLFCWLDKWHGLTMEDIRRLEEETARELDRVSCVFACVLWELGSASQRAGIRSVYDAKSSAS